MKLLLLILGISFFFILYFFYISGYIENSLIGNVFLEANIYVMTSFLVILYIWKQDNNILNTGEKQIKKSPSFLNHFSFRGFVQKCFDTYIYVFAVVLFYISSFFLLNTLFQDIALSEIFLVFNVGVLFLYFIESKAAVFRDFIRINTSVISLYYIFYHIAYISGLASWFSWVDIINIMLLWVLFFLFIRFSRTEGHIPEFLTYVLIFLYLEFIVICTYIFNSTAFISVLMLFLGTVSFLVFTSQISEFLCLRRKYVRIWGLVSGYVCIVLSFIFAIQIIPLSLVVAGMLVIISFLLYTFHNYFENYVSLSFSFVGIFTALYIIASSIGFSSFYICMCFFGFSALFLVADKMLFEIHEYDSYFFHAFSLLVNLVGCILFFLSQELSILSISILLMGESLYFFLSYYTLPKKQTP